MTNSAPHDGQRPPLSEGERAEMHETTEHLPRGASGIASSAGPRQDATRIDANRSVSAPVHAPLVDTPASHARNGLQILVGIRERVLPPYRGLVDPREPVDYPMALRLYGERAYVLTETELGGLQELLAQIARPVVPAALPLRSTADVPQLEAELREMERTNRELADKNADYRAAEAVIDALESQR